MSEQDDEPVFFGHVEMLVRDAKMALGFALITLLKLDQLSASQSELLNRCLANVAGTFHQVKTEIDKKTHRAQA